MSLQHAETFFRAFQNKKFLSRRDLSVRASISTVSADKITKKLLTLGLLKERKTPKAGSVGRPTRVLYVNPEKFLLILSLAEEDTFRVFVYSLSHSLYARTSYTLNKLLTREENIVSFFRETDWFLKGYFPEVKIIACGVLLPSHVATKSLWDTVRPSVIEHTAARFFPDTPCYLFTEMCTAAAQSSLECEGVACVKITENSLFAGACTPSPREIDLTAFLKDGSSISTYLSKHKGLQARQSLLEEMIHNLSLILDTQTFWIDHDSICKSPVFTEQIASHLKEKYGRENLTIRSFSPEKSLLYIQGCTNLTLHNFLKLYLSGGTE